MRTAGPAAGQTVSTEEPPTSPSAATPNPVASKNGVLVATSDLGKVYIWHSAGDSPRLLVIGQRHLVARAIFHILIDRTKPFLVFRPGTGLADGDPLDIVFSSTQPLDATTVLSVDVRSDGKRTRLGAYNVQKQQLVALDAHPWSLVSGFPLPAASAETEERQNENRALLDNFKALKANWPQLREPATATTKNVTAPLPDLTNRKRVAGRSPQLDAEGALFIDYGYVQFKLVLSMAEVYGCSLAAGTTILDWGVGCGRLARHMPPHLQREFVGIDVDPINIGWCNENLQFGRYQAVEPYSRTGFADRTFDFIYSHSVLTHLSEQDQFHWLGELARISRGLMILSVTGLFGAVFRKWARDPDRLWKFVVQGFNHSDDALPDIQDVTPPGYYRSSSHTPAYIYANWTRFVDVIDIIPGGFGSRQDAVICRPRVQNPT